MIFQSNVITEKNIYCAANILQSIFILKNENAMENCKLCKHRKQCYFISNAPNEQLIAARGFYEMLKAFETQTGIYLGVGTSLIDT